MAATTHFHFREHWRELRRGRPGRRFQARYERLRRSRHRCGALERILLVVAAIVLFLIGALLVIFPGPAIPFFFMGGALLATESRPMARLMDWSEVRLRTVFAWGKRQWRRLPGFARVLLLGVGACCSATMAYVAFQLLRR